MVEPLGCWEELRDQLVKALENQKQTGILIDIALHEQDIDRALTLLSRFPSLGYQQKVATAAEKTHPRDAISIYEQLANQAISERNRDSYQVAAQYLQQVKALHETLKTQVEWKAYIQTLRSQYTNFRALQDELRKANL